MPNRLQHETSPYLLQHRDNPVDWYPWGDEALSAAQASDKPIFLSVGYSACHWCHVMERESFEDAEIAELMNELFVNIKVDREERPDIDSVYMSAVQAMTGHGGWPMSVFLTPSGEPFYGGTYFPNDERGNMPSFPRVLQSVHDAYRNRRGDISANSSRVLEAVRAQTMSRRSVEPITAGLIWNAARQLAVDFDDVNGGTGTQPKFPQPMLYEFLLTHAAVANNVDGRAHTGLTLTKMQDGGIHDQIGGGFHRYSVDSRWLVPHFEKMLYDNALLSTLYLHAWQSTKHERFAEATTRTLDYLLREMRDAVSGAFYSATDADSEGEEGLFFTWTHGEMMQALPADVAEVAARFWGVTRDGNFEGRNILHVARSSDELAAELGIDGAKVLRDVERARVALYGARLTRVAPLTDDKVIASWNALAIGAFAEAGAALERRDWVDAARVTADFVLTAMVRDSDSRLMRTYKPEVAAVPAAGAADGGSMLAPANAAADQPAPVGGRLSAIPGFLEDYAYLAEALLRLYESDFDLRWLDAARWLCDEAVRLFWDAEQSAFYDAGVDQEQLVVRPRDVYDNAQPSGASAMTYALLRCAEFTGDVEHTRIAAQSLRGAMWLMQRAPAAVTRWLSAATYYAFPVRQVVIVGDPSAEDTRALLDIYRGEYRPDAIVAVLNPGDAAHAASELPLFEGRTMVGGAATAYVCRDYVCDLPVTTPEALREQLAAR